MKEDVHVVIENLGDCLSVSALKFFGLLLSSVSFLQPIDDYSVLFEDNSYADGYSPALNVAQRYVVQVKEPRKR